MFYRTRVYPCVMKPINVHYHFMAYKAVVIIAIVVPRAVTMSWDLKKKGANKRQPSQADRIERRPCGCTRWNVEVDDRGQWLVQGLWFELKFDAAPRRRFLPTSTAASVPRIVDGRLARSFPRIRIFGAKI